MEESVVIGKRNKYLDILRGIGAIWIIAIHTAFWSGQSYTPQWFQSITLLVDVPFFFFLSGWGGTYSPGNISKCCKGIINILKRWVFFVCLLALVSFIFKVDAVHSLLELLKNFSFLVTFPSFPVVAGSIWFMPVYIVVVFFSQLIIRILQILSKNNDDLKELENWYFLILLMSFIYLILTENPNEKIRYFLFYCLFWMMGFSAHKLSIDNTLHFVLIELAIVFCYLVTAFIFGINPVDLQSAKFPPHIIYFFASCIMVVNVIYFRGRINNGNRFLEHIGKNAVFYYFAQGIGSSIIYNIHSKISIQQWYFKWLVVLLINFLITVLIAETIALAYNYFSVFIRKILNDKE